MVQKCSIQAICFWLIFLFLRENFNCNSFAFSENVINKTVVISFLLSSPYHNFCNLFLQIVLGIYQFQSKEMKPLLW